MNQDEQGQSNYPNPQQPEQGINPNQPSPAQIYTQNQQQPTQNYAPYQQQPGQGYHAYPQQPPLNNNPGSQQPDGIAIASLVLGIFALLCLFFGSFAWLGIIAAIVGLILGISARKKTPSGMATAGLVLNIIALTICSLFFIACVLCFGALFAYMPRLF